MLDAHDLSHHAEVIAAAFAAFGGFDAVLVAWGVLPDQAASEHSAEIAVASFDTNARSVIALLTDLANRFEARDSGAIAVLSSPAGDRGRASNYVYGAAKAAVTVFASGLRNRLHAKGVRVLTIEPGFVDTPMTASFTKGPLWARPETRGQRHRAGAGQWLRRRLHALVLALDHGDHPARSRADLRSNEALTSARVHGSRKVGWFRLRLRVGKTLARRASNRDSQKERGPSTRLGRLRRSVARAPAVQLAYSHK